MPDFGNPSYWDERYAADEKSYDWYQDYDSLYRYLSPYLRKEEDFEVLIAGCGNSKLGARLYDQGYSNITNIDISTVVINQMSDLNVERDEMEFTVMDARNMEYIPEQCFDLIIDKGLFDALLCSENNLKDIEALMHEMYRVLKTGGSYVIISHGYPDNRTSHIRRYLDVEVEVIPIPKPELKDVNEEDEQCFHYMYVLTKQAN